jgi:hypothetical protein
MPIVLPLSRKNSFGTWRRKQGFSRSDKRPGRKSCLLVTFGPGRPGCSPPLAGPARATMGSLRKRHTDKERATWTRREK